MICCSGICTAVSEQLVYLLEERLELQEQVRDIMLQSNWIIN